MCHIYWLKYQNYDVNKNKMEMKTLHILPGLNEHAGSYKVHQPRSVLFFCVFFQLLFVLLDVNLNYTSCYDVCQKVWTGPETVHKNKTEWGGWT